VAAWRRNKYIATTICCYCFLIQNASAASCRWFARDAQAAIGTHVAALQRIEHEASDRLKGLDSRPFDFLLGEARKTTAIIADPAALKDEEELARCRNATRPIRKICAGAAQALVDILDKHVASAKPEYDKPPYAATMAACEQAMGSKPLKSLIRGND
jgi:hypothetical protein